MDYIKLLRDLVGSMPIILNSAGVIIRKQQQVLLSYRIDTNNWGIPGGYMELGETLEETAKREIQEELNLSINQMNLFHVFSGKDFYHQYPNGDKVYSIIAIYLVDSTIGEIKVDDKEISRFNYFDLNNLPVEMTKTTRQILKIYRDIAVG
ncbi:NUDIX hydrolase [Alkalihalobacillus deserti]|uniref:NUDIX hydrolase n=1 Tax=Alkalihalobacillus deserti TaxID=2879466 RepID=UPI001D1528CA|nr:NUDIX hydrolase [Alkalihalobacillus deserti]